MRTAAKHAARTIKIVKAAEPMRQMTTFSIADRVQKRHAH
jgi:hypothetical protein